MTGTIIVGYDGTDAASEAVHWAADEARARRAPLRLVSCFGIPYIGAASPGFPGSAATVASMAGVETCLAAMAERLSTSHPDVTCSSEALASPAWAALIEEAGADDLVVVCAGRGGGATFWLGTSPGHVIRQADCAVVVVGGPPLRGGPDRIVVGTDGSAASSRALLWAADEADVRHVPLVVVHGWYGTEVKLTTVVEQDRDLAEIDAAGVLEDALRVARERCGMDVTGELIERSPATAVLDSVRDGDLLVLGSHGRGVVRAGLLGSTVVEVLDHAMVPVVVVRGHGERSTT